VAAVSPFQAWFGWPNPAKRPLYGAFCLKMNVGRRFANNRSRAQIGFLKNGRLSKGSGVSLERADDQRHACRAKGDVQADNLGEFFGRTIESSAPTE
jgi:hypothetical protein